MDRRMRSATRKSWSTLSLPNASPMAGACSTSATARAIQIMFFRTKEEALGGDKRAISTARIVVMAFWTESAVEHARPTVSTTSKPFHPRPRVAMR